MVSSLPISAGQGIDREDQSDPEGLGELLLVWALELVFLVHSKPGGAEDSAPPDTAKGCPGGHRASPRAYQEGGEWFPPVTRAVNQKVATMEMPRSTDHRRRLERLVGRWL